MKNTNSSLDGAMLAALIVGVLAAALSTSPLAIYLLCGILFGGAVVYILGKIAFIALKQEHRQEYGALLEDLRRVQEDVSMAEAELHDLKSQPYNSVLQGIVKVINIADNPRAIRDILRVYAVTVRSEARYLQRLSEERLKQLCSAEPHTAPGDIARDLDDLAKDTEAMFEAASAEAT